MYSGSSGLHSEPEDFRRSLFQTTDSDGVGLGISVVSSVFLDGLRKVSLSL